MIQENPSPIKGYPKMTHAMHIIGDLISTKDKTELKYISG